MKSHSRKSRLRPLRALLAVLLAFCLLATPILTAAAAAVSAGASTQEVAANQTARRMTEREFQKERFLAVLTSIRAWFLSLFGYRIVPNLVGMTADRAAAALEKIHLQAEIVEQAAADTPAGTVIGQTPDAETIVRRGSVVTLTVSAVETVTIYKYYHTRNDAGVYSNDQWAPNAPESMHHRIELDYPLTYKWTGSTGIQWYGTYKCPVCGDEGKNMWFPDGTYQKSVTPAQKLILPTSSLRLNLDDSRTLTATVIPSGATIKWSSSDANVVSVSSAGTSVKITGLQVGVAVITASSGSTSASCSVTVAGPKQLQVAMLDGIPEYNVGEAFVPRGVTVTAAFDSGRKEVTSKCRFTLDGDINTSGEKTVTVTYGGVSTQYRVHYLLPAISASPENLTLVVGESMILTANSAADTPLTWETSDSKIATVSSKGEKEATVTGIAPGRATITVSNGYTLATVDITVRSITEG